MAFDIINARYLQDFCRRNDVTVIDLREPKDYARQHYRGALNLSMNNYVREIQNIPKNKKLIFYCERGGNSMIAARGASQMGFDARSVIGGYQSMILIDSLFS